MSADLITPDTKIASLLEVHPQLEDVLVARAPAFKKLQNPVLRKTVAKVTTLERAAGIAGIPVRDLVLELRAAVGQPTSEDDPTASPGETPCGCFLPENNEPVTLTVGAAMEAASEAEAQAETRSKTPAKAHTDTPPSWFDEGRVAQTIDAAEMLAKGEVPIGPVVQSAKALGAGEVLRVTIEFRPVPMIDTLSKQGFETFCREPAEGRIELFVASAIDA